MDSWYLNSANQIKVRTYAYICIYLACNINNNNKTKKKIFYPLLFIDSICYFTITIFYVFFEVINNSNINNNKIIFFSFPKKASEIKTDIWILKKGGVKKRHDLSLFIFTFCFSLFHHLFFFNLSFQYLIKNG